MQTSRMIAVASAAALVFTSFAVTPASAHHWHRGNAAVLGAVLGVFGTVAALAAADRYDHYYGYPYYDGPYGYYYGGGPYGYYAPRHYAYHRWHHHWHHH
jgi:hypothetical protein